MNEPVSAAVNKTEAQALPRYVKVLSQHGNGLIVFEFSIGWSDLSVELVLPQAAFHDFCARNHVILLSD